MLVGDRDSADRHDVFHAVDAGLGGWDVVTGERLWTRAPKVAGDCNVATPLVLDGGVLVATENNGTTLRGRCRRPRPGLPETRPRHAHTGDLRRPHPRYRQRLGPLRRGAGSGPRVDDVRPVACGPRVAHRLGRSRAGVHRKGSIRDVRGSIHRASGIARAPGAGVCRQTQQGLRSAVGIRESGGQDVRSERPATGHGHPRPTENPDGPQPFGCHQGSCPASVARP